MPVTCDFTFDRPDLVYYSGETINGHISLETTSEKNIRGVYIIFEGIAKVRWDEIRLRKRGDITEEYTIHYSSDETYLNTETLIIDEGKLPPGTHGYTFNIQLPPECPTSCTEKYGSISYEITLRVQRVLRFDNVFTQPLTVIKKLNLNHNPELLLPVKTEDIKYFCCWLCSSGPVISTLTIPFGGWAIGQEIPYKLEIDNQSAGYDVSGTELKFKQIYYFTAHSPEQKTRTHESTLSSLDQIDRTVLHLTKRIFEGRLSIPPLPPTSMDGGIIKVSYRIEMNVPGDICHKDSDVWMPITIGTIPIAQRAITHNDRAAIPPTAPSPDTQEALDNPPSYDICMPPTFEEATYIRNKIKETNKVEYQHKSTECFVPKYPMFTNFGVPAAASNPSAPTQDTPESRPFLNIGFNANILPTNDSNGSQPSSSQYPFPNAFGLSSLISTPSIFLLIKGIAKVRWEERKEDYTNYYSSDKTYLNTETLIVAEGKLPPGTHEYTFYIPLPLECPSSCAKKYGSISYEIMLRVERVLHFDNVFTQPVTVIKQLNLNHYPELLLPLETEDIRYICCWPCSSGSIISTLTLPFGGWAPGQEIPYKIEIDNRSAGYDVLGIMLKFKQIYQFIANYPERKTRTLENTLSVLYEEENTVLRLSKRIFKATLIIPPLPPTSIGSGIIQLSYRIEMRILTDDCKKDSKLWIPVIIGTVPLAQSAASPNHIIAIPTTAPSPETPDVLDNPPSYDTCMTSGF